MNSLSIAARASSRGISTATVLVAAILVLLPYGLLVYALPIGRDSGVFMYTGMVISQGGTPYVDSWDHKGPLLYLFNAAGFLVAGDARGIIVLEGAALFLALALSMHLWQKLLPTRLAAAAALLYALTYYATFELGNLTESWLSPFALVTYSLAFAYFCGTDSSSKPRLLKWLCISIGVSLAVAALMRPNNGLGLGLLACYLLAWGTHRRLHSLLWIVAAFAAIVVPVVLWIAQKHAMRDFIEQYFGYSLAYSNGASLKLRAFSAYLLSQTIVFSPLGIAMLVVGAGAWLLDLRPDPAAKAQTFYWLMLVVFAVDLTSQMLSGRNYLHYVLLSVAPLTLAFVALLNSVAAGGRPVFDMRRSSIWGVLLVPAILIAMLTTASSVTVALKQGVRIAGTERNELTRHLQQLTTPSDLITVHGTESWLLAAAGRRSGTSITYYSPAVEGFRNSYAKYQADAMTNKPRYIVEAPDACGLSGSACEGRPEVFAELRRWVAANYTLDSELHGYKFWRRVSP